MLYIQLLERMALIALAAYIYNQSNMFKNLIKGEVKLVDKLIMILFFSVIAILGTYRGVDVEPYALANTRPIGAIVAGYVGGPLMGVIVGTIAGVHRYSLGGFTATACGFATVIEGLVGGIIGRTVKGGKFSIRGAIIAGIIAEALQMFIILLAAKPYTAAVELEKVVALPMIMINTLGVVIFINIIKNAREEYNRRLEIYRLSKLEQAASMAELKALRAQIHPHFLFNALNTISSFCRTDPDKARELILNLSNYFRRTLKREEDFVALKEELEFIESYLAIEKARFGERLKVIYDIPEQFNNLKMPVFVLQPLIENAIKHGILTKVEGGTVTIKAKDLGEKILFCVLDTGIGMTTERYIEVVTKWPGIGLKNVNERLRLLYGKENKLEIDTNENKGTEVRFMITKEGM